MLQHIEQPRGASVGSSAGTRTLGVVWPAVVYGGMGYGVYLAATGSIATGALVFFATPMAALLAVGLIAGAATS
jgi:hypothetical protein